LDVYTMLQHHSDLESAKIVIVGDIKHSRVARSTCQCLNALGITNISLVAPQHLLPEASEFTTSKQGTDLDTALENADIVMALRIQKERMLDGEIPDNDSYHQRYGINSQRLEKTCPQALVMHPGPMNRGVEISSELADSQRSLISAQVNNGLFIRMALFDLLLNKQ
ncbi:MAG: aspartate carbamoyltransferase catalytic subunit, partial [Gammaproteobacteria bacterium]|nr:aspartate carbamoyltransferase catalytic subunit [Gammaproteobacteria bacterium]